MGFDGELGKIKQLSWVSHSLDNSFNLLSWFTILMYLIQGQTVAFHKDIRLTSLARRGGLFFRSRMDFIHMLGIKPQFGDLT